MSMYSCGFTYKSIIFSLEITLTQRTSSFIINMIVHCLHRVPEKSEVGISSTFTIIVTRFTNNWYLRIKLFNVGSSDHCQMYLSP